MRGDYKRRRNGGFYKKDHKPLYFKKSYSENSNDITEDVEYKPYLRLHENEYNDAVYDDQGNDSLGVDSAHLLRPMAAAPTPAEQLSEINNSR